MGMEKCPDYIRLEPTFRKIMRKDGCVYPYYGLAPHLHLKFDIDNVTISATVSDKNEKFPDNFVEDPESPGCGTYLCPYNEICK